MSLRRARGSLRLAASLAVVVVAVAALVALERAAEDSAGDAAGPLAAGDGARSAGARDGPPRPRPGQVFVDPDHPAWFARNQDSDGDGRPDPLFIAAPGDPEDFLYRGARNPDGTRSGDQSAIIEKLAGTGANAIYMQAVRSHGGDGDETHNPFVDNDPERGVNDAVLAQWESWFDAMDRAGIIAYFFFYDDSACIWGCEGSDRVPAEERAFLEALVERFERFPNLVWVVAEEYQEAFTRRRVSEIAAIVRSADAHGHPIAVHQLSGNEFDFERDSSIAQFAMQLYELSGRELHDATVEAVRASRGRYNVAMVESRRHGEGAMARRNHWGVAMAGAYVMVLGMDVADTPLSDLLDLGRVRTFFEQTAFIEMAPRDDLAAGDSQYVLARPGHAYIAYSAQADEGLGLRRMRGGSYDLLWLDTVSGLTISQDAVVVGDGEQRWAKPDGFGEEVALYLRRSN